MCKEKFIPMISDEEKNEVDDLINEYNIKINNLHIMFGDNKFIAGIFGNIEEDVKDFFKYDHFIESINDLALKTKISIEKCLDMYQEINYNDFNPLVNPTDDKEHLAYYFLENALLREVMLWESLGQLYNLFFKQNLEPEKVNYKTIINNLFQKKEKTIDFEFLKNYVFEEYDKYNPSLEKGIHNCVCYYRNQLTHRYSIAITSLSYNTNLRAMPDLIYKIGKDYNVVLKFLMEIVDLIVNKINSEKTVDKIINFN